MPTKRAARAASPRPSRRVAPGNSAARKRAASVLAELERIGSKKDRDGLTRYGIVTKKAFGVSMSRMHALAKRLGRDRELAAVLWSTGWYEARTLAAFLDDPERVTPAQMDRWCRDFDNWGICDTVCFHLFDRTPHAFGKISQWTRRREEFVRRAGLALLAGLAGHDREAGDAAFAKCLPLVERAASDERNFVKKAALWALRRVGERSPALHAAALKVAERLAASSQASSRWVGQSALRDLGSPAAKKRLAARGRSRAAG